ncbi:alpha/beta hydrolase [Synechococcus moorigangaii CMS01]|nr:alpha/beta hydrolase [Synechococcus moorigangaii CMS01]
MSLRAIELPPMEMGRLSRRIMLNWLLMGLILAYFGVCAVLFWRQRQIIFFPQAQPLNPVPVSLTLAYETVKIPVDGQQILTGWWFPGEHRENEKTVLFLHGNGGLTDPNFQAIALWQAAGYAVLAFNYRGYGSSSPGFPQEAQVYADAIAAYDFLTQIKNRPVAQLILHGHSLGGAIAIELASQRPVAGLFLESTFTSMVAMATIQPQYRIFPVSLLLNQRFDSAAKIAQLQIPIVIAHGDRDDLVPLAMGKQLWAIATAPKQFLLISGADHTDAALVGAAAFQGGVDWLQKMTVFPSPKGRKSR